MLASVSIYRLSDINSVNQSFSAELGVHLYWFEEALTADAVQQMIKDEFKASVRQVLQNALRGIETDNFELPLYSRQGQRVEQLLLLQVGVDGRVAYRAPDGCQRRRRDRPATPARISSNHITLGALA